MTHDEEDSMSELHQTLSHSKWDGKYQVVFVPKRRRKGIFGQVRRQLGQILHGLARQQECQILEGHLMPDHVHMCTAIPPRHPVASVIGFLKGKSAIAIARLGVLHVDCPSPACSFSDPLGSSCVRNDLLLQAHLA
jgi:REP element-mobilizing transposase RayT